MSAEASAEGFSRDSPAAQVCKRNYLQCCGGVEVPPTLSRPLPGDLGGERQLRRYRAKLYPADGTKFSLQPAQPFPDVPWGRVPRVFRNRFGNPMHSYQRVEARRA